MRLKVYYDGECGFCGKFVRRYREKDRQHQLEFIDITNPTFVASAHGLDSKLVLQKMHVKDEASVVYSGGDAIIQIWAIFPQSRWLAKSFGFWLIRPFFNLGYLIFARYIRPILF